MSGGCMKRWKYGLLLQLVDLIFGIISLNVEAENAYSRNDDELTRFQSAIFYTPQWIFDPLGLNFAVDRTIADAEETEKVTTVSSEFPLNEETPKDRHEDEEFPKMITTAYDSIFDRRYTQRLNYSEIYNYVSDRASNQPSENKKSSNHGFKPFQSLEKVNAFIRYQGEIIKDDLSVIYPDFSRIVKYSNTDTIKLSIYEYLTVLEKLSEGRAVVFPLQQFNSSWNIVHTNSGNEILSIRISAKPVGAHEENPIIVVVAGIHGRDWYAIQSAIFAAERLILNENDDINEDLVWWIVPILNPDGYQFSRVSSEVMIENLSYNLHFEDFLGYFFYPQWRNWKKNIQGNQKVHNDKCFGIDLDFGFEYQWLSCNASVCDSNFPGEEPFSVPETQGLRDTLEAFGDILDTFVVLKEGRQSLVYPFSDTLQSPRNVQSIYGICKKALESFVEHVDGVYDYGQSSHLIELRAGFIEDWAKIHLGVDKSFAFYLGPTKKDRRELKTQHLIEHTTGTFEVLKVLANGRISPRFRNSSSQLSFSFIYYLFYFLIIRKHINE